MYEIDKGVPVPDEKRGRKNKYPYKHMQVGDSFWVGPEDAKRLQCSASQQSKRYGIKVITRKEGDGRRAWRIE